ncbi:MAG: 50S ribosomal protein L6 [Candidatus Melainabacteria bacterium]
MSRIGKAPINVPEKVEITIEPSVQGTKVTVKGPKGSLTRTFRPEVNITRDGNVITVVRVNEERESRSLHGLSRTLLYNMIVGVSEGFTTKLEIVGVGYRAAVAGQTLTLTLGYSHPIELAIPAGMEVKVEANTKLEVSGPDKELVGQIAANIRAYRPPEPYKGKGVRYAGEKVRRKAGKSGKK